MTRHFPLLTVLTLAAVLILAGSSDAEIGFAGFEAGINTGYSENILKDSTGLADSYRTADLALNLYPLSMAEIKLTGNYTFYDAIPGLTNFVGGAGFTLIPLKDTSPLSLYLSGNYRLRNYRQGSLQARNDEYNTTDIDGIVTVGYRLRPNLRLRIGAAYKTTLYEETEYIDSSITPITSTSIQHVSDKHDKDFFGGFNWTLPGSNVLDIEAGYMVGNLQVIDPEQRGLIQVEQGDTVAYNKLVDGGDLQAWYISPRISRPLGKRSGLSVTYSHRGFIDKDDSALVYGYSTGLQSPWVSAYEGDAIQINLKTYLVEKMIVTAGFGYMEKTYIDVLEMGKFKRPGPGGVIIVLNKSFGWHERRDQLRQAFFGIQIPIQTHGGLILEPSLNFNYTSNSSSVEVYEYSDFTITSGINVRF